ncbi:MAG: allophanate hydrolase [Verrucomicrobiota bacterium]
MDLSIKSLKTQYAEGSITPRSLVEKLRRRIVEVENPNVWIHLLDGEELEPYLAQLDGKDPASLSLFGIPFAIKDNIDLAGVPTTAGCPAYSYTPTVSGTVVENLIKAGAIPMGKTNLDQFATGLVGVRSPYGTPRNPYAPKRVPGGSSCGSAVALSEGLVSFSLGTDTAGSGRVPAAFNKLWGIKPSRGRLSNRGLVPACRTLDCISIFALSGEDGRVVLDTAESYDPADSYSQPISDLSLPASKTIGIPKQDQLMFFGDADYNRAWETSVEQLKEKGWQIVEVNFQPFLDAARLLYEGPWVSERTAALKKFLESNPDDFFPATKSIISGGMENTAVEAFDSIYKLADLRRQTEAVWEGLTAIVTPTAGGFPSLEDLKIEPIGPNSKLGYYTNFMNLLDLCAVAVPSSDSPVGLPFGVTWMAPRDTDKVLIDLATNGPQESEARERISILLFGAHMSGLPFNTHVQQLGAAYVGKIHTAEKYRMSYLPKPEPHRPGIFRVDDGGVSITGEEWSFPFESLGKFLATIHQPLGLGEIELKDGRKVHGFLCEASIASSERDISEFGGWREFIRAL